MLCQKCNQKQATFHYKSNVNGRVEETHLCQDCYQDSGFSENEAFDSIFDMGIKNLFPAFFKESLPGIKPTGKACPLCGSTYNEIIRTAKVGCGKCYDVFRGELEPLLTKLYGGSRHQGSIPESAGREIALRHKVKGLRDELQAAIEEQRFERAAELRDELKRLEGDDGAAS